jgi:hypothetical protein
MIDNRDDGKMHVAITLFSRQFLIARFVLPAFERVLG